MKVINRLPDLIAEYRAQIDPEATQVDIAKAAGVDPAVFSRYINNHVNGFKFEIEYRLCVFFTKAFKRVINVGDIYTFDQSELERETA